jgi:hypothetical protein
MRTCKLFVLLTALPLAACIFGGAAPSNPEAGPPTVFDYSRAAEIRVSLAQTTLPRGGNVSGVFTFCPAIIYARGAELFVYEAGQYRLAVRQAAELGIAPSFGQGDVVRVPAFGDPDHATLPPVNDPTRPHCISRPFTLTRGAGGVDLGTRGASLVFAVEPTDGSNAIVGPSLDVYEPDTAAPPPTAAQCAVGRWLDSAPPAAERVSTTEFDAATFGVGSMMVARSTGDRLLLDTGNVSTGTWSQQTAVSTPVPADSLRLAVPRSGPRAVLAWRDTDYSRPAAEQTRVQLAWPPEGGAFQVDTVATGFESALRGLQLAVGQGEAVVGWLADGAVALRSVGLASRAVAELAPPPDLPGQARVRALRLATDPSDDGLVLALALQESDGALRLHTWRRSAPGAGWLALPTLEAGTTAPGQTLGDLALTAANGEVLLAWSWGETVFSSSNARQQLQLRRWSPGSGWRVEADTAALADPARRYGVQPLSLQVAAGCGGSAFLAWNEPADYPRGAVHGAVASAGAWDPFGRTNLAPLPGGTGAYSGNVKLRLGSTGRPVLFALLASPSGGEATVVVRRYVSF